MLAPFNKFSLAAVAASLLISGSRADSMMYGFATVAEVLSFVKTGAVVAQKRIMGKQFLHGAEAEARIVYAVGSKSGVDITVAVARNPGRSMDQMEIEIVQKLSPSAHKVVVDNVHPFDPTINATVRAVLEATEVNAIGRRALDKLDILGQVNISTDSIGTLATKHEGLSMELPKMTLARGSSEVGVLGDLGGSGTMATFRIDVGISKTTTPEEIQVVLDAITAAAR